MEGKIFEDGSTALSDASWFDQVFRGMWNLFRVWGVVALCVVV